ncbi:MAG: NAD-dependent epimerase/dehydratase family protein [Puniceicoccaceae bacterium]
MSEKRMVIFGCGYVGRALAEKAVEAGYAVWIQSRNPDALGAVDAVPEERRIIADLHEPDWHAELGGEWDIAINLVSSAGGGIEGYRLSYLEGNRSIRNWASKVDVGRFVYSSATSVYPQTDGQWISEDDVPRLDRLSENGRVLRQAELEILESEAFPRRYVARLGGIYGPGRHLYLNRLREGATSLPGDGLAWLNLIYLYDIVDALMQLAEAELPGCADVFNVVDNEPARKQAIVDWLAESLAIPAIPFDPNQAGPRALRRSAGKGLPNRRISNRKIREVLGWEPAFPDFQAGYRDILKQV